MLTVAIFGGTFDPIHNGHIQTSLKIQAEFQFDHYYFVPCKIPLLKSKAQASTQQRIEMLSLALNKYPKFEIDLREINRDSPSYMVETLDSFRAEYQEASITLILGYDAFLSLPQWHQSSKILELANLLVINRVGFGQLETTLWKKRSLKQKEQLLHNKAGSIYYFNAGEFDISSTEIRSKLKENQDTSCDIPQEIQEYIKSLELYL